MADTERGGLTVATLILLIVAAVLFALGAITAPMGRFNPVAGGLLALTIAVWLLPYATGAAHV